MTSACGVVTELLETSGSKQQSFVDREARSNYKGQRSLTVEFRPEDGLDFDYVQRVEKELSLRGRHTYSLAPKPYEDYALLVKHLNNAGILVLLYADGIDTSIFDENRSYKSGWKTEDIVTASDAADYIYKLSAITGQDDWVL